MRCFQKGEKTQPKCGQCCHPGCGPEVTRKGSDLGPAFLALCFLSMGALLVKVPTAVMKCLDRKATWGERELFGLSFHIVVHH